MNVGLELKWLEPVNENPTCLMLLNYLDLNTNDYKLANIICD